MTIKTLLALSTLAVGAAALTGCGGGSSGTGPTPPPSPPLGHTVLITGMSIQLPPECASNSNLFISDTYSGNITFGGKGNTNSYNGENYQATNVYNDTPSNTAAYEMETYQGIFSSSHHSSNGPIALANLQLLLGDGTNDAGLPDYNGGTDLVCKDNQNNVVHINFRTYDGNGNKLSDNTNLDNLSADYDGPIVFVGYKLSNQSGNGIYLYDPKNPKAHQKQTILNNTNKL